MIVQPGFLLKGQYRIDALIGGGGMAMVYRAYDLNLRRVCVVKQNLDASPEAQRQFHTEAVLLAGLHHAHLPRVTDHFLDTSGQQYLVMDFVEGENLEDYVARNGPLSQAQMLAWMAGVFDAVAYCHSQGVIHRDIKPANLIKRKDRDEIVLVDFGIAKQQSLGGATLTGAKAATPSYAPLEQFTGHTDARSDIYSLGATLYFLLTGRTPPDARLIASGVEVLQPPSAIVQRITPAVEVAILQAMSAKMADRPATAMALQGLLDGSAHVRPPKPLRLPRLATAGALVAVALLIVFLITSQLNPRIDPPTPVAVESTPSPIVEPAVASSETVTAIPEIAETSAVTASLSPTVMEIPLAAPTSEPTRRPTSTTEPISAPFSTSTPISTPTPGPPTSSRPAATAPAEPTTAPGPVSPAPVLVSPNDGDTPAGSVTLIWSFPPGLSGAMAYQVWLRTEQGGQEKREATFRSPSESLTLRWEQEPDFFKIAGTEYFWKVAVINATTGERFSDFSAERRFVFRPAGSEGAPDRTQPTPTEEPTQPPPTEEPTRPPPTEEPTRPPPPTERPAALSSNCPSYLHQPLPGMGILLVENHIGEPLHLDRVGTTEKWDIPAKQGDHPGRLLLDLPPGHHEFVTNTYRGYGHIGVNINAGEAFISPIWYNDQAEEKLFPLEIPASCP